MTVALSAQAFTTIHSFSGPDGSGPDGVLVQGADGNLYGTTFSGGVHNQGTIFKITPSGVLTTLHSLDSHPFSGLILGRNGSFYGTTGGGGTSRDGTIFQLAHGTLTTLHNFDGSDGRLVDGPLVEGVDGNLFGTTEDAGRKSGGCPSGCGTIFTITPSDNLTTLLYFNFADGFQSSLLFQSNSSSDLYGTTVAGGANGVGEVYKIGPGGFTLLHSFSTSGADGDAPVAGVVEGMDALSYGLTTEGGAGNGTVFSMNPGGSVTTIYAFDGTFGGTPYSYPGLTLGSDGQFYGTAYAGGANGFGTIFSVATNGAFADLHDFDGTDGQYVTSGLVQATSGVFYGVTQAGGSGGGTVYSLSLGLAPFVLPAPAFARVGQTIYILGTNLTGSTSVTFGGIAASFTVVNSTSITATVPAGANSSGFIQVVTPATTLSSKLPFHVLP